MNKWGNSSEKNASKTVSYKRNFQYGNEILIGSRLFMDKLNKQRRGTIQVTYCKIEGSLGIFPESTRK